MSARQRVRAHLRWRHERLRTFYRGHLFDLASRHRSVVRTRDKHGNSYVVSSRDSMIGRALYMHGAFETEKLDNALRILAEQDVAISGALDIGANIGTTTIELLFRRPDLTIDCFEPEPFNYQLLTANLAANARGRARAHQVALSDVDGSLTFELSPDNAGDHRVRSHVKPGALNESERRTIIVPARRLDTLALGADTQTLACIDVQGHEWNVLAGGSASLRGPVTLEFWPYGLARNGHLEDLIDRLGDLRRPILDITFEPVPTDPTTLARQATNCDPGYARELLILPS